MNNNFVNIDEYINARSIEHQDKLNELKRIIKEVIPNDTQELISYKMPTFRRNGNIIHFAQMKHHIGIYPGAQALEIFRERLKFYKTSKGTWQIPNNQPLDKELIQDIVTFNMRAIKSKKTHNWTAYQNNWTELYEKMNATIAKLNLKKEIKWGMDIYTFQGKNVIGWAGFKNFFSIWFHNGVFLTDPYGVLITANEGKTKSLRQWRITNVTQFEEEKIIEYIEESIQTIKDGKFVPVDKPTKKEPEGILKEALQNNTELQTAFGKLTLSKQKEYIEYINDAKQEKTKIARLEKITPMMLGGQGLNDKYKR